MRKIIWISILFAIQYFEKPEKWYGPVVHNLPFTGLIYRRFNGRPRSMIAIVLAKYFLIKRREKSAKGKSKRKMLSYTRSLS